MRNLATIFVPTTYDFKTLSRCLFSLKNQTKKDFKVIVVGLRKDTEVQKILNQMPYDSLYLIQKKKGLVRAANEALRNASEKYFIRIDDDVVVDKNWFKNIINTFDVLKKAGAVTGPTVIQSQNIKSRDLLNFLLPLKSKSLFMKCIGYVINKYLYDNRASEIGIFLPSGAFSIGSNLAKARAIKKSISVENIEACNFAVKTSLLKKLGGFDVIFNAGLGDYHEADIAQKIKKAGYEIIFNPNIAVEHRLQGTSSRSGTYYRIQNLITFYFRHLRNRKNNSTSKFIGYLLFQNVYYLYKGITTGDVSQFLAIPGTIVGLIKHIW
jgi:GT2 family glycosyltransferase